MRLLFVPLCLALVACSSDPAQPVDAGSADTGTPVDLGRDAPPDITEDRPAPVDVPGDQGVDAVVKDWPFVDTGSDAPLDVAVDVPADVACNADAGLYACGGVCRDLVRDNANCGRCGDVCAGAARCMGATCVDLQTDPMNCGGLGRRCNVSNATPACVEGDCAIGSCRVPFADCDTNPGNGCETNTQTNATNCGACGSGCDGGTCTAGRCS